MEAVTRGNERKVCVHTQEGGCAVGDKKKKRVWSRFRLQTFCRRKKKKQLTWAESLNLENFRVKAPHDCELSAPWSEQTREDAQVRRVGGKATGWCVCVRA